MVARRKPREHRNLYLDGVIECRLSYSLEWGLLLSLDSRRHASEASAASKGPGILPSNQNCCLSWRAKLDLLSVCY